MLRAFCVFCRSMYCQLSIDFCKLANMCFCICLVKCLLSLSDPAGSGHPSRGSCPGADRPASPKGLVGPRASARRAQQPGQADSPGQPSQACQLRPRSFVLHLLSFYLQCFFAFVFAFGKLSRCVTV